MANASRLSSIHDNKRHRPASAEYKSGRDSDNWYMNALYIRHDFEECMNFIEECLKDSNGLNQFTPVGDIHSSLTFFQTAACLDPLNIQYLKEVAKSLALLGQHGSALEIYTEALKHDSEDWELYHSIGLCNKYLGDRQAALDSFRMANDIQRHDDTCIEIAELCIHVGDIEAAIEAYNEALEFSPENTNILTRLGILLMKAGDTYRAFECLGNSLVYEPKDPKTILAAASVIQDNGDVDVALVKYRIAAIYEPFSSELWSNVGLCFFGNQTAIACLKRALSLGHFQWRIYFNLGLLHLFTGQYASAFVFLSSALNLEPSSSLIFMYLGIALSRLDDFTNSRSAYARAIGNMKEATDDTSSIAPIVHLNCCITAFNHGDIEEAKKHFLIFDGIYQKLQDSAEDEDDLLHELIFPRYTRKESYYGIAAIGKSRRLTQIVHGVHGRFEEDRFAQLPNMKAFIVSLSAIVICTLIITRSIWLNLNRMVVSEPISGTAIAPSADDRISEIPTKINHSDYFSPGNLLNSSREFEACPVRYSVPIVLGYGWWFRQQNFRRAIVISDDEQGSACLVNFTHGTVVNSLDLLSDSIYDVVIAAYTLEVSQKPWESVKEYVSLLVEGGHLVVMSLFFWPDRGSNDYFRFLPSGLSNMAEWAGCRRMEFSDGWGSWDFWALLAKDGPQEVDMRGVQRFIDGGIVIDDRIYKSDGENYFLTWAVMTECVTGYEWSSQLREAGVQWPPTQQLKLGPFDDHIFDTTTYTFEPCKLSYGRIAAHHAVETWLEKNTGKISNETEVLNISPPVGGLDCWGRHFDGKTTKFFITHWNRGQHEICEDLPFPDNSFNYVLMQMVAEHSVFVWYCYREVHRVLKKGGIFISTNPVKFRRHPLGGSQKANKKLKDKGYAYPDNYRLLPSGNRALLEWAGFSKIHECSGWGIKRFFADPTFDIPKVKSHMLLDRTSGVGDPYVVTAWLIAEK